MRAPRDLPSWTRAPPAASGLSFASSPSDDSTLCQATGARLAVHRDDAPYLRAGRPRERMTFWGMADWLPPGLVGYVLTCAGGELRLLEHGEIIAGLTVVHGPGHTPGSIGLWSAAESAIFTGDILNNGRDLRMPAWAPVEVPQPGINRGRPAGSD